MDASGDGFSYSPGTGDFSAVTLYVTKTCRAQITKAQIGFPAWVWSEAVVIRRQKCKLHWQFDTHVYIAVHRDTAGAEMFHHKAAGVMWYWSAKTLAVAAADFLHRPPVAPVLSVAGWSHPLCGHETRSLSRARSIFYDSDSVLLVLNTSRYHEPVVYRVVCGDA